MQIPVSQSKVSRRFPLEWLLPSLCFQCDHSEFELSEPLGKFTHDGREHDSAFVFIRGELYGELPQTREGSWRIGGSDHVWTTDIYA